MKKNALPIYFMHVPKCAGVSVFEMLRRNFASRDICPQPPAGTWTARADDVPGYQLYAGHFSFDFIEEMRLRGTRLIMLRHPLSRVISLYDYWRSYTWDYIHATLPAPPAYNGPALAKSNDLSGFLAANARFLPNPTSNIAAQQLLGSQYVRLWPDQQAMIDIAIGRLHTFDWIGIAEAFEPSVRALERLLQLRRVPLSQANSTYETPADGTREPVVRSQPTLGEQQQIMEANRLDEALYNEARKTFERGRVPTSSS